MRVLVLTNLYPNPRQPHRATFNRHQLRLLGERTPVRVIAPIAWTDEWRLGRLDARRREQDGLIVEHPRYWFPPRLLRGSYGRCYEASVCGTFRRAVAEFRPDLVFAPWAYPDGWAAVRLARAAGLSCVIQVHGSDVLLLDEQPTRRKPTAEALRTADGVVAVSLDLKNRVVALGVDSKRVRVVYDGVDRSLFCPGPRDAARARLALPGGRIALFVGNLVPVKNVAMLLDLAERRPDWQIYLIGEGPLRRSLEQRQLANEHLLGAKPQSDLPDWYRAADVVVLPSRSEGVPNVLLEATACGTPWVASHVGGIPEIANGPHCTTVEPGNLDELIRGIGTAAAVDRSAIPPVRDRADAVAELHTFLSEVAAAPVSNRPRTP